MREEDDIAEAGALLATEDGPAQLPLPFGGLAPRRGAVDFHVAAPNEAAHAAIRDWRGWTGGRLALVGPPRSGKSHLASIWAAEACAELVQPTRIGGARAERAVLIEGADRGLDAEGETALFHLHNRLAERGLPLLLTGRAPPARWPVRLPDLASRLAAIPVAEIGPPDDALLAFLMVKLLADRQLSVAHRVVRQLVTRMERSYAAVERVVVALDAAAMASGRTISPGLASEVLDRLAQQRGR